MSSYKKCYLSGTLLILIALGAFLHSHFNLANQQSLSKRETGAVHRIQKVGEKIYQHKKAIDDIGNLVSPEALTVKTLLTITRRHNLKPPLGTKETTNIKRLYQEKTISFKLKDEKLKSVVEFMIDAEQIRGTKVRKINFTRNPKDKDLWNVDLVISKIKKKDLK